MSRNVALYPWLLVCQNLLFWMPAFFLYFSSLVPLSQVLLLESLYYLGVVVLEVPSGYFSDRVGRRITLFIAAGAWTAAGIVFAASASFAALAAAQLLLAAGMAFFSGTDTALLYDSLAALGRAQEFGPREARARGGAYLALGLATAVGGMLAGVSPRAAYALFAAGSCAAVLIVWHLSEPPAATARASAQAGTPPNRLRTVLGRLRQRGLDWLFAYTVAMTVLVHVPYEFLQPYLRFLLADWQRGNLSVTPPVAGAVMTGMMLLSAVASSQALRVQARLGVGGALLAALGVECGIVAAMAAVLHPLVVLPVLLRSVPWALMTPIVGAATHPHLESTIRATYFSLQSLAGRLAFSLTLALASWAAAGAELSPGLLERVLWVYAVGGLLLLGVLAGSANRLRNLQAPAR